MKNAVWILAVALILFGAKISRGEAGPPIPKHTHTITQAVQIVQEHFIGPFAKDSGLARDKNFKPADFFVMCARYAERFGEEDMGEWCWVVTLTHPVANDITYTFKLTTKGNVILLAQTV